MSLFERGKKVMPGGVNSPVRSFGSVGGEPLFIKSAQGSKIIDVSGKAYIDYVCSWGPMILGHNHPDIRNNVIEAVKNGLSFGAPTEIEVMLAEKVKEMVPNIDMVRMVNSGTEAVMSALRLARGYSGKDAIIKFEGCYHGHTDSMLVNAGSGAVQLSSSLGVGSDTIKNTLVATYNDLESVKALFEKNKVAAVIIEPVAANMGVVSPKKDFLAGVRKLCDENKALLIFDEVITGFRLAKGGAQEYFGINADIVTMGKIIGGGMPVGAYGGKQEIMQLIAPLGDVYQAGTLSGNPIAMTAGYTQLCILNDNIDIYDTINKNAVTIKEEIDNINEKLQLPICVNQVGSLVCMFFTPNSVTDFASAKKSDVSKYGVYFHKMLKNGINLAPAQFEAMFVSYAHTQQDVEYTLKSIEKSLKEMKEEGVF